MELTYILTTFNKLKYLKVTLPYLIESCMPNEEIVVIDGGSNDGTKEYLENLYSCKKIHQFISEKDFGEAHGYNKALLIAKGKLIKIISDDDIYAFDEIQKCKLFMLKNEQFDLLASNVIQVDILNQKNVVCNYIKNAELDFIDWKNKKRDNTFFCGLSLMIRKKSLPLLGLFNCYFKMIDIEYSVRVSSLNAKIVFYTNPLVVSTINENSNSKLFAEKYEREQIKVALTYEYFNSYMSNQRFYNPYSLKESFTYIFKLFFDKFFTKQNYKNSNCNKQLDVDNTINSSSFASVYQHCLKVVSVFNVSNQGVFIERS